MTKELSIEQLELEARFFSEALDIYAISDLSGNLLEVNASMLEATGYRENEMLGKSWFDFVHEADQEATKRELEAILTKGRSRGFTNRIKCKNGAFKFVEWSTNLSEVANNIFSLGRDISHARREHESLNGQLSLQRAIIDSSEFSIISTDASGLIQTFNRHAERMLGYAQHEVIGKGTPYSFFDQSEVAKYADAFRAGFGSDEALQGVEVLLAKARAGLVEERSFTLTKKSGRQFEAHISISALRNEFHEVYGFLFVARDVTEERRVERLKNEFISTVSHELRTPMTSIRGAIGIIADGLAGEVSAEAKPLIDMAVSSCDRLIRLINDILDIEKIDGGNVSLNYKVVELAPLIEQAIASNRSFAEKHHVNYLLTKSIPFLKIKVDVDRFAQILDNLLSNAAKYTEEGDRVEIEMQEGHNSVRVLVTDHGRGIPDSFRPKVFAKFMQANSSDRRDKGGTGLGLAICKALVERQGGHIDFTSEEGKGTTFFFDFPVFKNESQSH